MCDFICWLVACVIGSACSIDSVPNGLQVLLQLTVIMVILVDYNKKSCKW